MRAPLVVLAALSMALAGCSAPETNQAGSTTEADVADQEIEAGDNVFVPQTYETTVGTTVKWRNTGQGHHTVTVQKPGGANGEWLVDSGDMAPGATFSYPFPAGATYDVFCRYHSQGANGVFPENEMTMKVTAR